MKPFFVFFLVLLTLAEMVFTAVYCFLSRRFDLVPLTGTAIYLGCVVAVTINYRVEAYRQKRTELLDNMIEAADPVD